MRNPPFFFGCLCFVGLFGCASDRAILQQQDYQQRKVIRAQDDAVSSADRSAQGVSQIAADHRNAEEQITEIEAHLSDAKTALTESRTKAQRNKLVKTPSR